MKNIKLYIMYIRINLLRAYEYRTSFFVGLIGLFVVNFVSIVLIWIMFTRFSNIGGWTFWEVVFNYSLYLACLGLHKVFFKHILYIEDYIVDGTFDRFLIRPCSPLLQLVGDNFNESDITDFILGIIGISIAYENLNLNWDKSEWIMLILYIVNGVFLFTVLLLSISSLSFWLIKATPFLYGTSEIQETVQHYPIDVFGKKFKLLVSTILPYALVNYYPVKVLLNKTESGMKVYYILYTIIISIIFLFISINLWKKGINHYKSTGS